MGASQHISTSLRLLNQHQVIHFRSLFYLEKKNVNFWWSQQTQFTMNYLILYYYLYPQLPCGCSQNVCGMQVSLPQQDPSFWTVPHGFEHTVGTDWFAPRGWESAKSQSHGECFRTHKCSTWLVWVNFDIREGSASLRIEPLEAALSQSLGQLCTEVNSHQREKRVAE